MAKKVWKVSEESKAGIEVQNESITASVATADHPNGIKIDTTGVYIAGKVSIMTSPEQIRVGGFWVQNSPFMQMLPSTLASPIPNLIFSPPLGGIVEIGKQVAFIMGFLV